MRNGIRGLRRFRGFRKAVVLAMAAAMLLTAVPGMAEEQVPATESAEALTSANDSAEELEALYDSAVALLYGTDNVTMEGKADFLLDGVRFKTAMSRHVQDDVNSIWVLQLWTPREDREDRESGFTIISNGSQIYVMEVLHPGEYRTGNNIRQNSALRHSVQMDGLIGMGRLLAEQAGQMPGITTETQEGEDGRTIHLRMTRSDLPPLGEGLINLAAQNLIKRYFEVDYDWETSWSVMSFHDYPIPARAIIQETSVYSLRSADLTFALDAQGRIQRAEGTMEVGLTTKNDGEHLLTIGLQGSATAYGSSEVPMFDPAVYGAQPGEGQMDIESIRAMLSDIRGMDYEKSEELIRKARDLWYEAGVQKDLSPMGETWSSGDYYYVSFDNYENGDSLVTTFSADGEDTVLVMENRGRGGLNADQFNFHGRYAESPEKLRDIQERLMEFLRKVDPKKAESILGLGLAWETEQDGAEYLQWEEYPLSAENCAVFVVQVESEWRIEFYAGISNG